MWRKGKRRWKALHPEPAVGYTCVLCGGLIRHTSLKRSRGHPKSYDFTLDHIIPISVIMEDELDIELLFHPSNLQAAHSSCNSHKGNSTLPGKIYASPQQIVFPGAAVL